MASRSVHPNKSCKKTNDGHFEFRYLSYLSSPLPTEWGLFVLTLNTHWCSHDLALWPLRLCIMWAIYTVRCRYNEVNFHQNRHPIAHPSGRGIVGLLWVQALIYVLPPSPKCYMRYRVVLDRLITALHFSWQLKYYRKFHWDTSNHSCNAAMPE